MRSSRTGNIGSANAIHLENVSKNFGDYPAVRNLSLEVNRGRLLASLG